MAQLSTMCEGTGAHPVPPSAAPKADDAELYRRNGWWPDSTVYTLLAERAAQTPDKILLVDRDHRISYREAVDLSDRLAAGLHARGVGVGDVVSVQMPNWYWFPLLEYALARLGAVCNPLPAIYRHRELRFMLSLVAPRLFITCGEFRGFDHVAMADDLRQEGLVERIVVVDGQPASGMETIEDLLGDPAGLPPAVTDADLPSEIAFTSGTTGEAKGVVHTHNSNLCPLVSLTRLQRLGADDVILMASTFGHNTGFVYGGQLPVFMGGTVVLMETWNGASALDLIERERVTWIMGATPFLSDLCEAMDGNAPERTQSLRIFLCSGAPIPRALLAEARARLGCAVVSGWGMTEIGLLTLSDFEDEGEEAADTDGSPLTGNALRILDAEGRDVPAGEEGDIVVRGPTLFRGYYRRPEMTESSFTTDGWLHTGDRGRVDAGGRLRITGRTKDIIVRGGENIPIVEVEELLHKHPKIRNVVVVGVPDPRLQERACAAIIPVGGEIVTLDEIREYLTGRQLAKQYFPEFVVTLDRFPTTPSGKIQKFILREEVVTLLAGKSGTEDR